MFHILNYLVCFFQRFNSFRIYCIVQFLKCCHGLQTTWFSYLSVRWKTMVSSSVNDCCQLILIFIYKKIELIKYSHPWLLPLKCHILENWKYHNMQTHKFLYFLPLPNQLFPPEFLWDPVEFPVSKLDHGRRKEPNNWSWMEHPFSNFRTKIKRYSWSWKEPQLVPFWILF